MKKLKILELHQQLICQLKEYEQARDDKSAWVDSYLGTSRKRYGLGSPARDEIVRQFLKANQNLELKQWFDLLDVLYFGESFEERMLAGQFLIKQKELRTNLKLTQFNRWLGQLSGWAEVDTTCQSTFFAEDLLDRWQEWDAFLEKLSKDKNVNKRRASLVIPIKALRQVDDRRLEKRAFDNVDRLRSEKDILITKAVSWILRSMTKNYHQQVAAYIRQNKSKLPAIAYRETKRKLETGKK